MPTSQTLFWGLAAFAAGFLAITQITAKPQQSFQQLPPTRTTVVQQASSVVAARPSGGHIMPDGTWMAGNMDDMQSSNGMGCGMGGSCACGQGGGCGCGGMMRRPN